VCVCLSICLRGYLRNHTRDLYRIFCIWPWLGPSPAGWRNPKWRGNFGFSPTDNALYCIAFGTHTKTTESIQMPFRLMSGLAPRNSVLRGSDDPRRGRGNFRENVCRTSIIPLLTELDWSMPWHTTGADAWLQSLLDESIIGCEVGVRLHTAGEVWYLRLPRFMRCRVFEAFGKVLSVQLAPDLLRPGKHRYVSISTVSLTSPYSPIRSIVTAHTALWIIYNYTVESITVVIYALYFQVSTCPETVQ